MSASFLHPTRSSPERTSWAQSTIDMESTADLEVENTTDLAPVTEDFTSSGSAELAGDGSLTGTAPDAGPPGSPPPPRDTSPPSATVAQEEMAMDHAVSLSPGFSPGTVLGDRYLLEQAIGAGGTAIVYRARDMLSSDGAAANKQVAIKLPRTSGSNRTRDSARIKHEFDHAHRLSHPAIVRVLQLHEDEACCFMVMELIEGTLLADLARDWTTISPPLAWKILRDCAQALAHAHQRGVVHGDFKPGNVFVTAEERAKVVDFGAAATMLDEHDNGSRICAGTPAYASPQVLAGLTPEPRDDIFSFACVAYELLTGQHPFERRSSVQARDEDIIPPRAWSLLAPQWLALLSALSWERADRPDSIESLMDALMTPPAAAPATPAAAARESQPNRAPLEAAIATELHADLVPRQGSWGFYVFIACALLVTLFASQRQDANDPPAPAATDPQAAIGQAAPARTGAGAQLAQTPQNAVAGLGIAGDVHTRLSPLGEDPSQTAAVPAASPAQAAARTPVALSELSFQSSSIVTSERAISAVFLVRRTPPLSERVQVQWSAASGTADAGIDFIADGGGTITFAEGQSQSVIYVPLQDDLLREGDETFSVQLHSPQNARLGSPARSEATILDDD